MPTHSSLPAAALLPLLALTLLAACRHTADAVPPDEVAPAAPPRPNCNPVEDIPSAPGETTHVISCASTESAFRRAHELCPDGYDTRTNPARVWFDWKLVVSCKTATRHDVRVCEAAYPHVGDFATHWAQLTPGATRLEELPDERDFVMTCREMRERVQRCMHELYREAHAEACDALLTRVGPATRAKLDGLFLEAKPRAPAEGGAP